MRLGLAVACFFVAGSAYGQFPVFDAYRACLTNQTWLEWVRDGNKFAAFERAVFNCGSEGDAAFAALASIDGRTGPAAFAGMRANLKKAILQNIP